MSIGDRIKHARKQRKLNQVDLAELLGVAPDTISRWETDKRTPRAGDILKLAMHLDFSPGYFMENEPTGIRGFEFLERLNATRRANAMTEEDVDRRMGFKLGTTHKLESDVKSIPDYQIVIRLAELLGVDVKFLIGETDTPRETHGDPLTTEILECLNSSEEEDSYRREKRMYPASCRQEEGLAKVRAHGKLDFLRGTIEIPLLSMATAASCGLGNGLYGVDAEMTEFVFVDQGLFREFDDYRKPFAIWADGDSMEAAGVPDGSIVIINPAETVRSGDMALVNYNDSLYVKWVIYAPDGSIELRSANQPYIPIKIEKEIAEQPEWLKIIGKVVEVSIRSKPQRAF